MKILILLFPFLLVQGPSALSQPQVSGAAQTESNHAKLADWSAEETIKLYPSPTNGPLNIKIENGTGPVQVEVFDMLGNLVENINLERKGKGWYTLDLSSMNKGLYFVKIQTPNQFVTKRVTLVQ